MDYKKIIYPGLAALFTAGIFYALGLIGKAPTLIIPSQAVVPFNASICPDGWDEYKDGESHFIVGAGQSIGLRRYALGQEGGVESYVITEAQMPKHQHNTPQAMDNTGPNFGLGPQRLSVHGSTWENSATEMTSWAGGSQSVDNIPPFIALRYCIKK